MFNELQLKNTFSAYVLICNYVKSDAYSLQYLLAMNAYSHSRVLILKNSHETFLS